jgi:hypothetical protein|tara:strand:+ start:7396 stop:7740 length:345 start_codon:yes stop_codon:yes gene_type:complete
VGLVVAEEYAVTLQPEEDEINRLGVVRVIWRELSGGVGPWGAFRPIFSILVSLVPFVYLGQHFNGQHSKALGWSLMQLPLILTVLLFPILYIWSILDSWWFSSKIIASKNISQN